MPNARSLIQMGKIFVPWAIAGFATVLPGASDKGSRNQEPIWVSALQYHVAILVTRIPTFSFLHLATLPVQD